MSSDESDADSGLMEKRKKICRRLEDSPSSSSSGSPIIGSSGRRRRLIHKRAIQDSSEDSESDSSFIEIRPKRKRVARMSSESESVSSDSDIITRAKRPGRIPSESEEESGSSSEWATEVSDNETLKTSEAVIAGSSQDQGIDSDFSDGQSEKCPICLLTFKVQEIGTPESCDHMFCLECIQEWSKNMNTCPVDRIEYNLILVRKNINSERIIKRLPIEKPQQQNEMEIFEDVTFCEICGSGNNEDRLLLCDGCDLGFHLYCLTPPLDDIPAGSWYCNECSPDDVVETEVELYEIQMLFDEAESDITPGAARNSRRRSARLVPRTRQTERVRRRIQNNRSHRQNVSNSVTFDGPSTSRLQSQRAASNVLVSSTSTRRRKKPKRKYKRRAPTYRTVYEIDQITGEAVPVKKRVKTRRRRKTRRRKNSSKVNRKPATTKGRLAAQLGICAPKTAVPQTLPDVRIPSSTSSGIAGRRNQAGIPTLHLFGARNEFDYFSDEGESDIVSGGPQLLTRRAPNRSDILAFRRNTRLKATVDMSNTVSSSTDILGSILDTQEKFLSKQTVFSVDQSGKLKMDQKGKENNNNPDLNSYNVRQRPYGNNRNNYGYNNRGYNYNRTNNYHSQPSRGHYTPSSTMQSTSTSSASSNVCSGGEQNDGPQDYTQRTLCEAELNQEQEKKDDAIPGSNTPISESDVDIYSDIEAETVSTSRVDEGDRTLKPASPTDMMALARNSNEEEDNDSESGMVIDTEKVHEENKEETAVTSTVDSNLEVEPLEPPPEPSGILSMEIQSEAVQSSSKTETPIEEDIVDDGCPNTSIYSKETRELTKNEDEEDSDDGCPNFSIYSKESKKVALTTDISLPRTETTPPSTSESNSQEKVNSEAGGNTSTASQETVGVKSEENEANCEETVEDKVSQENPDTMVTESDLYEPKGILEDSDPDTQNKLNKTSLSINSMEKIKQETVYKIESAESQQQISDDVKDSKAASQGGLGLYSDSEDETVVKKNTNSFAISDIKDMTEDILSEEERSYTPCLDEREKPKEGLEGLDTEMISDEDRNDFDESHEMKTVSDGDALEINAKESELDFTRPEDYEEGEIVDKNKETATKKKDDSVQEKDIEKEKDKKKKDREEKDKEKDKDKKKKKEKGRDKDKEHDKSHPESDKNANKENENKELSFKKLSKSNKERNYRDKDRGRSRSKTPEMTEREKEKENKRKKERRKELERYNVRALIADKPRAPPKDKFGRDLRRTPSASRSRSYTPPITRRSVSRGRQSSSRKRTISRTRRSASRGRRSASRSRNSPSRNARTPSKERERNRKRGRSRSRRRTVSHSRSRTPIRKRSRSKNKKRKRTRSREERRRKSKDKVKKRAKSRSGSPRRRRPREWTPSFSRSPTPELHQVSPSWTPPRVVENTQAMRSQNLTVILNNDQGKKKKEKKRKGEKRKDGPTRKRRRERERTPPPSKEVFASGDNILVSVSFNNENETRDVTTRERRKKESVVEPPKKKKEKKKEKSQKKDLSGVKPVAIIDLERSPFQEIPSSPKDIIVLSDSDNNENETRNVQTTVCDSSKQTSPERIQNYSMGPKTPPEPQIKFSLTAKPPQLRAISNPLHEPDENNDEDIPDNIENNMHKGPNTPPEPPNSPPSSPDAYDPFEPTKSRSATPEPTQTTQNTVGDISDATLEERSGILVDLLEKANQTPDLLKSMTPPVADIQPADSQSSIHATPESNNESPEQRIGVVINQLVQPSLNTSKPVAQTTPFSSVSTSIVTSTPVSSNLTVPRINILNSTLLTPTHNVASCIPQRIVLPNQVKSSPVKISPTKAAVKSTPIKPMQSKNNNIKPVSKKRAQNGSSIDDVNMDIMDSPYSPGSSDYEDLFEPPSENVVKPTSKPKPTTKSPQKQPTAFDTLFGSPVANKKRVNDKNKFKKTISPSKTKQVGVKVDEDSLKILEEMPNSAVEMQVKDKFLKKLNRQERVVEEVKLVLKPHYNKKRITKEEYKDIMRRAVPKICHNKSGEINPTKIKHLIEAYVKKVRHSKKVTSSSSVPQKV